MLDTMLGVPMETALGAMNLPASVNQALSDRTGPLAPFLTLTLACETGDDTHFAECANTLGLNSNQINWAHLRALAWAESITQAKPNPAFTRGVVLRVQGRQPFTGDMGVDRGGGYVGMSPAATARLRKSAP